MSFLKTVPKMSVLLIFLPVAIVMKFAGNEDLLGVPLFICTGLGILGTVTLIGKATEEIAIYTGPLWGGLLNATFGNVTELIIALFALSSGPRMYPIVLGSIVGSILGNLLLVLGAAMLYGGAKYPVQKFSRTGANVNVGMLYIVLIALSVPSFVHLALRLNPDLIAGSTVLETAHASGEHAAEGGAGPARTASDAPSENHADDNHAATQFATHAEENGDAEVPSIDMNRAQAWKLELQVSMAAAILLLLLYVLSLLFSLRTHRFLLMPDPDHHHEKAEWSKGVATAALLGATFIVAFLSEAFVGSIEHMREHNQIQMSEMFIGVIVVAIVGNAAEGMVAIWVAREDKMELSYQIAMGSCLQVALMVAPVLVIASYFMNDTMMSLAFDPFMLMSLAAATFVASASLNDGESNWLEGAMFLAVYIFFALVFWFHP